MNLGRIEQSGTPEEIYDQPRSEFVARFIGSSNVVKGKGSMTARVDLPASSLRCTGEKGRGRRADGRFDPSARHRRCAAKPPAGDRQRRPGHCSAAGLFSAAAGTIWLRSRTARSCAWLPLAENIPQGSAVWLAFAARRLPGVSGKDCQEERQESSRGRTNKLTREDTPMSRIKVFTPRCSDRLDRDGRRRAFSTQVLSAAPPASAITPALIEAAKKEGKVVWYTSVDLPLAEKVAKAFEAKFPGIAVRVERTGAERVFQRIGQEYGSNIHAVDVVNSSDAAHFIVWKSKGCARGRTCPRTLPSTIRPSTRTRRHVRKLSACGCASSPTTPSSSKAEDAPKSYADLLDPKWTGKIVKAHPSYAAQS